MRVLQWIDCQTMNAAFRHCVARSGCWRLGRACPLCPGISDIDLFRYRQGLIDLDAEITDSALDLCMSEQKLDSPEIAGAPVDQRSLRASQRVRPKQSRVQSNAADPFGDHWPQQEGGAADPVGQRRAIKLDALPRISDSGSRSEIRFATSSRGEAVINSAQPLRKIRSRHRS
jgi:hypothetical protein